MATDSDDDMMTEYAQEEEEEEEKWDEPQMPEDTAGPHMIYTNSTAELKSSIDMAAAQSTSKEPVNLMALNTNKAGMEGLDKDKINKIIMEASKGSRFYENEKKKEAQVNTRVDQMRQRMAKLSEQEIRTTLIEIDKTVQELEDCRDLSRFIVHLDMDAFYAAVEERDDPSLKDKPMAVGGMSMLSTSNYLARKFGVRAAMPGFIGKKLCPELVIVPGSFDKYRTVSRQVREILAEYDPNFCPMSLDEAYLDLTEHVVKRQSFTDAQRTYVKRDPSLRKEVGQTEVGQTKVGQAQVGQTDDVNNGEANKDELVEQEAVLENNGINNNSADSRADLTTSESSTPIEQVQSERSLDVKGECVKGHSVTFGLTVEDAVEEIRFRIQQKTQLTASAGIAPNCMLAKICSDKNKPNGQYRIEPSREVVMDFVNVLPIRKVSGIGKVTERMLSALGIQNCADLYKQRALLHLLFSSISSHHFLRISLGIGSTQVERDSERKSMSTERTFHEINKPDELFSKCRELCEALAEDLAQEELKGKTVGIKIKTVKFDVKTRVYTVPSPVCSAEELFNVAKDLLKTEIRACQPEPLRLRLMGVRISSLEQKGKSNDKQNTITKFFKKKESSKQLPLVDNNGAETSSKSDCLQNRSLQPSEKGEPSLPSFNHSGIDAVKGDVAVQCTFSTGVSDVKMPSTSMHNTEYSNNAKEQSGNYGIERPTHSTGELSAAGDISLVCPVCNKTQSTVDLGAFNEHVDACLIDDTQKDATPDVPTSRTNFVEGNFETDVLQGSLNHTSTSNFDEAPGTADLPGRLPGPNDKATSSTFNQSISSTVNQSTSSTTNQSISSTTAEEHPSGSSLGLVCPICCKEQRTSDLEEFNTHVDVCLNKGAIKEILHQQAETDSQSTNRQLSPTKIPSKRSGSTQQSTAKRRKQDKKQGSTLHKFFN
ncbi:DNA polymerase kappa-like [Amphiura filiformis]|uniref:DNA polymerase kappa-like n=1 Tax=Amphiura filiformis TaxID=82378 RepID=UPI003B222A13